MRILIGSCGGLTGSYLARQLKQRNAGIIVGADAQTQNVTRHFVDEFVTLPSASSPDFLPRLLDALQANKIDCYLPTHSKEIREVSRLEQKIRAKWQGSFIVSPYETYLALDGKQEQNRNFRALGIPVPTLFDREIPKEQYPIFLKPNSGSGSRASFKIDTPPMREEFAKLYPDSGYYAYIDGTEYTVDCLFDMQGKMLGYNQRVRLKSVGGAVTISQNRYDFDIQPYLQKIAEAYTIKGCVNFQYILSDGIPYFIDVNLRYAAGGLPLSVQSGLDIPGALLAMCQGRPLPPLKSCGAEGRIMYRYYEELYEDPCK